jgi:chaperonin GroES
MIEQVLGARILVKRIETPVVTSALLEVVKLDDEPSQFAIVVSVGNGERREDGTRRPLDVEVNDRVITKLYCGTPVTVDCVDYHIVVEDDILAILKED